MDAPTDRPDRLVALAVERVWQHPDTGISSFVLREVGGPRHFAIYVGRPEAAAIQVAQSGAATPRPMTHDAIAQVVEAWGATLERVVVAMVPGSSTYTADVVLGLPDGGVRHLDWRPSDAVALALRRQPVPPILCSEALLDEQGALPGVPTLWRLACTCGESLVLDQLWWSAAAPGDGYVEGPVECHSCGRRTVARLSAQVAPAG
ncbi:MAG: bifunctional nuclease family protein [Acidimicrobiales bacterium]